MVVIGVRMLCREGWIGLLAWFQCHYLVGWLVMLCCCFIFWWLVRGCGVVIMVLNWNCRGCDWGIGRSWGAFALIRVLWSRECCDFERFVRFGWFTLLCWSKLWGDYCWVVVILDSWVGVVSCDSWGGFGGVSGWFAYDRDWVRCRGWGFVLVSILSAFVAYVVVDWCVLGLTGW